MYNNIVPDELQNRLIALKDSIYYVSFEIGDICNEILDNDKVNRKALIYQAVGLFSGKSARTVREYASVSAFYDMNVRKTFDVLSYDHFRMAMRYKDRWYDALRWSMLETDEMGRPATVDAMISAFCDTPVDELSRTIALIEKVQALIDKDVKNVDLATRANDILDLVVAEIKQYDKTLLVNIL